MRIGILGSGLMGGKLGTLFARAGHDVVFGVFKARRGSNRPSMVYCGDDAAAKKVTVTLIRDVGFEPVDAGPLRVARYTGPFTLLMAQLVYEGEDGPEIAYRVGPFEPAGR